MKLTSRVYQSSHNTLLIDFLSTRFTYLSKLQWMERISDRQILLNDKEVIPEAILKNGDIISYFVENIPEPEADCNYKVIYEDEWIVAIDKPGNLLVHKSGSSITKNLVYLLRHCSNNPAYASLDSINRLDRETSGIVLFSKSTDCLKRFHALFAAHKVEKRYCAIVKNCPPQDNFTVDLPIGQDTSSEIHYKFRIDASAGKPASTSFSVIDKNVNYALLRAFPVTGRTHQIRIHSLSFGCPIFGDKLYGMNEQAYLQWRADPQKSNAMLEFPRQALHCEQLDFIHPFTNEAQTIAAPIPVDLRQILEKLRLTYTKYLE